MPSGAKKRKAAKKKKEKGTNTTPSTNNPQGDNELKSQSQDERGSDGGEGGSPAYRDSEHAFGGRNEDVVESDPPAAQPSAAVANDIKIDDEERGGKDLIAEKSDEGKDVSVDNVESAKGVKDFKAEESNDASVVHIESAKKSDYVNGSSGGISHDEPFTFTAKSSKDEPYNSVKPTVAFDELVKSIDSSHAKMALIAQNAPVEETVNAVVESSAGSFEAVSSASVLKRDTGNALVEKSVGSQVGSTDIAGKSNEDKVYPFSDEDARASSLEEPRPKKFDLKVSASVSHGRNPESTNGAEHAKDSETPECSENQPLVASAPHMVQKTSWLSCCGLFEVLSGSSR